MNKPNQVIWRFPDFREEVKQVQPADANNTSSLTVVERSSVPDDDWE